MGRPPKIEVEDTPASDNSLSVRNDTSGGYGSSDEHVFSDPSIADYWRKKYEKAGYENRHRYDPNYKWTAEEEKRLVRKVSSGRKLDVIAEQTGERAKVGRCLC